MSIELSYFLQKVEENASRTKIYHQPGDGSNGECDCIGLIIGAKRLAGGKWTGLHGSNYAARSEIIDFGPAKFFLGEIVFKCRPPGATYYDLPDRYKPGGAKYNGDLNDYYHVGVVTSVNPLVITHCTSPGPIARDTKKGKWCYGGRLKDVNYGTQKTESVVKSMVILQGGNVTLPINFRRSESTSSALIASIPQGSKVELVEQGETWSKVVYDGKTGYVLSKFIQTQGEEDTIKVDRKELERAYDILGDLLGLRG